jgi:arylsulfatase A-like enzyme
MKLRGLLALGVLAGCSEREPELPSIFVDLLARSPDRIVDQPGELRPGAAHWAAFAYDGWHLPDGERSVAWAVARKASLRLPLLVTGDIPIELELQGPRASTRVKVALNDHELGEIEVGAELGRQIVQAPAAVWQRGDNVLSLQGSAPGQVADKNVYFGLARVAYAEARLRVEPSPRAFALPAGCSVAYRVEALAESRLALRGRASRAGRLELRMRLLDPTTGEEERSAPPPESFAAADDGLELCRALPRGRGVVELDLTWLSSDAGSSFTLERLGLEERAGVERPSVLFVSIDTLSAQHLSLHGYGRKTSPNLEAFARDAVLFRNCRSNAPWTIPSYMSQLTGLFPRAHTMTAPLGEGRLDPTPWETQQMAPSRWTLAEFFRAAGYRTAAFVDNPWLTRGFGFRQGFEEFDVRAADIPLQDPSGGLRHIAPRVLDWLDSRRKGEPFFLFVQAFDPHAPYHAAAPWKGRFDGDGRIDEGWELPVGRQQAFAFGCVPGHIAFELCSTRPLPERLPVAPIATAYDEKIAEVDETLAQLLAGLKERGVYDELLIVFSADHGESTVNHDLFFNHALLYGDTLHVPFLLKLPGQQHAGRVIDSLVQLVDLYPTLVEVVRPDARRAVHGSSLLPLIRGEERAGRVAFAEGGMMEQFSVEEDGWKLIVTHPLKGGNQTQLTHPRLDRGELGKIAPELATGFLTNAEIAAVFAANPKAKAFVKNSLAGPFQELYYLPDDPFERNDVAARHPERVQRLLAHAARLKEQGELAKSQAAFAVPPVELGGDDLEEMRALGYVGE